MKWPPLSAIRYLELKFINPTTWWLNLPDQLSILYTISSVFPTALHVRLCTTVEWRRIDAGDGQWRPFVLNGRRSTLRALLMQNLRVNSHFIIQDYEGCFSALFDPTSVDHEYYLRSIRESTVEGS